MVDLDLIATRRPQLDEILADAQVTIFDLEIVFERRDFGDDSVYDPDELDETESELSERSVKILAKLLHLLTSTDGARTSALAVAHFCETGTFIPREN